MAANRPIHNTIMIIAALLTGLTDLITYVSLRKQNRKVSQQSQGGNRALQQEFLKTVLIVTFIEIFTLVPASFFGLVDGLSYGSDPTDVVFIIVIQMYWLNFTINPLFYVWGLKSYRRHSVWFFVGKGDRNTVCKYRF